MFYFRKCYLSGSRILTQFWYNHKPIFNKQSSKYSVYAYLSVLKFCDLGTKIFVMRFQNTNYISTAISIHSPNCVVKLEMPFFLVCVWGGGWRVGNSVFI